MERACKYCNETFLPKRSDTLYCTPSCRQLAYVLRKAKGRELKETSIAIKGNEDPVVSGELVNDSISISRELTHDDPSIEIGANKEYSSTGNEILTDTKREPSIIRQSEKGDPSMDDEKAQQTSSELTDNNSDPSIKKEIAVENSAANYITTVNALIKTSESQEKYTEYGSTLLTEIVEFTQGRNHIDTLYSFLHNRTEGPSYWISIRYRCLLECILTLSEMHSVELDDLKEACNALTDMLQSRSYRCMISEYPYFKEIPWLRDTIKNLCLNAEEETLTFRLKKETKLKLIASRWELAGYVPKIAFDKLNFKEQ